MAATPGHLMIWLLESAGHQQPCCCPSYPVILQFLHHRSWYERMRIPIVLLRLSQKQSYLNSGNGDFLLNQAPEGCFNIKTVFLGMGFPS